MDGDDHGSARDELRATRTLSVDVTPALATRVVEYARARGMDVSTVVALALASLVWERPSGQ